MSNTIKYSEGSESLALNKGNWWIGTGDSNKGPTVESGYWNAINPPSGGYTVYLNKESNGPSIHSIADDEKLISFTNKISGNNYTTVSECLVYYQTQDDKLCVNREIENIVTDGLVLNLDAGYVPSYPTSGTTWYDLSGNGNNGTLVNGTIFSSGSMVFDGVDDTISIPYNTIMDPTEGITLEAWIYPEDLTTIRFQEIFRKEKTTARQLFSFQQYGTIISFGTHTSVNGYNELDIPITSSNYINKWNHFVASYRNGYKAIYINGELLQATTNITGTLVQGSATYYIGSNNGANEFFEGNYASCKMYNRGLISQEILQNYNATKSRFGL